MRNWGTILLFTFQKKKDNKNLIDFFVLFRLEKYRKAIRSIMNKH
jgi:hypothetical protein